MATKTTAAPIALEKDRNRSGLFYPFARIDMQVAFEGYDLENIQPLKIFRTVPKQVTVHKNSYKEPDTWKVTFDSRDLPFTTESVRTGSIEIRLFQKESLFDPSGNLTVLDEAITRGVPPTMVGLFDKLGIDFSDNGKEMSISGTDYTALFADKQWPKNKRIPTGRRLDLTMQKLMDEVVGATNMRLNTKFAEDIPIVGAAENRVNRKKVKITAETYWDAMYSLAIRYGYILFVRGLEVVMANPRTFIDGKTEVRKLAWGKNLTSLQMSRKLGRQRSPTIEMRGYDDFNRKPVVVRYPTKGQRKALGIGGSTTEIQIFTNNSIRSKDILRRLAEARFNLLARAEQEAQIETQDLRDLDGEDIITLAAGDAVTISFDPLGDDLLETQPFEQRKQHLIDLGYNPDESEVLALALEKSTFFRRPLRIKEVTIEWDVEKGMSISADLQNFVLIDLKERKP